MGRGGQYGVAWSGRLTFEKNGHHVCSIQGTYVFLSAENKTNTLQNGGQVRREKKWSLVFYSTCIYGVLFHDSSYHAYTYVHISLWVDRSVSSKRAREEEMGSVYVYTNS